jgi:hypothetical protein
LPALDALFPFNAPQADWSGRPENAGAVGDLFVLREIPLDTLGDDAARCVLVWNRRLESHDGVLQLAGTFLYGHGSTHWSISLRSWISIKQRSRIARNGAIGARHAQAAPGAAHPLSPGPSKAELREQAAEAVASYSGLITRCSPKRRKAP